MLLGVSAIGLSYVIGWPAIAALGAFSIYVGQLPLVVIGGPLLYGLSHLVFIGGMYLAGAKYTRIFFRWATRVTMEKLMRRGYLK